MENGCGGLAPEAAMIARNYFPAQHASLALGVPQLALPPAVPGRWQPASVCCPAWGWKSSRLTWRGWSGSSAMRCGGSTWAVARALAAMTMMEITLFFMVNTLFW